jgi:hypothetical protein
VHVLVHDLAIELTARARLLGPDLESIDIADQDRRRPSTNA